MLAKDKSKSGMRRLEKRLGRRNGEAGRAWPIGATNTERAISQPALIFRIEEAE